MNRSTQQSLKRKKPANRIFRRELQHLLAHTPVGGVSANMRQCCSFDQPRQRPVDHARWIPGVGDLSVLELKRASGAPSHAEDGPTPTDRASSTPTGDKVGPHRKAVRWLSPGPSGRKTSPTAPPASFGPGDTHEATRRATDTVAPRRPGRAGSSASTEAEPGASAPTSLPTG